MTMRERIIAAYDQHVLRRSVLSIRGDVGEAVFREAMQGKGYQYAVEIGTYRGVGAAVMSQFCEVVLTFDLKHGRMEQLGETWDRHAFWTRLGVQDRIALRLVDDDKMKAAMINAVEFDFAFIDGAHDAASVARDFDLVKRCGRVLFHDYDRRGIPDKDHVCDFVDALPKDQVKKMDIFALWTAPRG
jgi:predicted O-methyltransferase YrrM